MLMLSRYPEVVELLLKMQRRTRSPTTYYLAGALHQYYDKHKFLSMTRHWRCSTALTDAVRIVLANGLDYWVSAPEQQCRAITRTARKQHAKSPRNGPVTTVEVGYGWLLRTRGRDGRHVEGRYPGTIVAFNAPGFQCRMQSRWPTCRLENRA